MELQWLLETILFVFVAFIVAGVILIAVLGWSLYRARRRIDMLAARAGTLETKLAPKMSSSRQNATPQTEGVLESGGEQDPAGPTRPEAARPFRFGNHPFLTVVLVIVLLGISILIPGDEDGPGNVLVHATRCRATEPSGRNGGSDGEAAGRIGGYGRIRLGAGSCRVGVDR